MPCPTLSYCILVDIKVRVQHGPFKGMGLVAQELGLHKLFYVSLECGQTLLWAGMCSLSPSCSCQRTPSLGSGSLRPGECLVVVPVPLLEGAGQRKGPVLARSSARGQAACLVSFLS